MRGGEPKEVIYRMEPTPDGPVGYHNIQRMGISTASEAPTSTAEPKFSAPLSGSLVRRTYPIDRVDCGDRAIIAPLSLIPERRPEICPPDDADAKGTLGAFGMFWKRSVVTWSGTPKLLGRRSTACHPVNFARQIGVYLLHDEARTIYVGRAGDNLYVRLKAHTSDRMAGRWNRFSWFGLRRVSKDGQLLGSEAIWNQTLVINTIEALLIESVEPPLNRRRGDGLSDVEYLQATDTGSEPMA